jgi:hypothetical protein
MEDSLHERGKAIEDLFFKQCDEKLLDNLRKEIAKKEIHEAFHHVSGISDAAALDALVEAGITPESLTSIAMVPLVVVAWADKVMEPAEKAAILQAAEVAGVHPDTASYVTMECWLEKRPSSDLLEAWKAYIRALKPTLDAVAFSQLKHSILDRAEKVASATGGFLGLGSKVSESERKVLSQLAKAFQ